MIWCNMCVRWCNVQRQLQDWFQHLGSMESALVFHSHSSENMLDLNVTIPTWGPYTSIYLLSRIERWHRSKQSFFVGGPETSKLKCCWALSSLDCQESKDTTMRPDSQSWSILMSYPDAVSNIPCHYNAAILGLWCLRGLWAVMGSQDSLCVWMPGIADGVGWSWHLVTSWRPQVGDLFGYWPPRSIVVRNWDQSPVCTVIALPCGMVQIWWRGASDVYSASSSSSRVGVFLIRGNIVNCASFSKHKKQQA